MSQGSNAPAITDDLSPIAKAILDHVNAWPEKPLPFKLSLEKDKTSAIMQPLPGASKVREYVTGSYIGQFPFALFLRIEGADTKSRLNALETLNKAAAWLTSAALPIISADIKAQRFELTSLPAQDAVYDDASEDYQAIFRFTFKKSI